jgi:hypothetical protein
MSERDTKKNEDKRIKDKAAQPTRERELRDLIEQVEAEKSGSPRPLKESPHDFIERRVREKFNK